MEISMAKLIALIKALGGGGGGGGGGVSDVKVNGTSVVTDGVAEIPKASSSQIGVLKVGGGLFIGGDGKLTTNPAGEANVKGGDDGLNPIVPQTQHASTFFGLAKAAGANLKSVQNVTVGTYTETAKSAISQMFNAPETVSGSTPSIVAKPGVQYICGEVSTIDITVPESGIIDVIFESGSTPAVLTVTPPTGKTMKWAGDFDPTSLEANTTYEINIMNGCLGVGAAWT